MWYALGLTVLASASNNIGKVLQKKGTKGLPRLTLDGKVVMAYLTSLTWTSGLAVDVLGALLMLRAVSLAPVSVVQPVSACGLAILALFSHFYLKENMQEGDWLGVALAAAGTIGVGVTAEDLEEATVSLPRLAVFAASVAAVLAVVDRWAQIQKHWKRYHQMDVVPPLGGKESADILEEITTGTEAGACFGLSAAMARTGFLLAHSGYPRLCIPVGIAFSISLSSGGFLCQTRGLKEGRAVVVSTCAAVASIVTGVLVGMVALGESLPQSFLLRFIRFLSWMLIVGGIVLLVNMGKPTMLRRYMRRCAFWLRPRSAQRAVPLTTPSQA